MDLLLYKNLFFFLSRQIDFCVTKVQPTLFSVICTQKYIGYRICTLKISVKNVSTSIDYWSIRFIRHYGSKKKFFLKSSLYTTHTISPVFDHRFLSCLPNIHKKLPFIPVRSPSVIDFFRFALGTTVLAPMHDESRPVAARYNKKLLTGGR